MKKERCVSIQPIMGNMAQWVVRQSPFHSARGVDRVNAVLLIASKAWQIPGLEYFSSCEEIEDWLRRTLTGNEWFDRWNSSFIGHFSNLEAEGFIGSSRYWSTGAAFDFIDIDALFRNVSRSVWEESAEYEREVAA